MTNIHEEIRSLLAAYVLDAVPADEVPAIRAHILSCEECFAEADSYAESLAALSGSVDASPLPEGFADRVVRAAIGESAVVPAKVRSPWFRRMALRAVAGLAALLLVVTSVSLIGFIQRQRTYERIVASLIRDDDALRLQGPGGATAVVATSDSGATLVAINLGDAPEGSDYQLWLMKDGVPTPSETFDASGSVVIVDSVDSLEGFDGAAITVEPDGGSPQPTTEPILSS
jgi:anti-sigma-K factor RskA